MATQVDEKRLDTLRKVAANKDSSNRNERERAAWAQKHIDRAEEAAAKGETYNPRRGGQRLPPHTRG